MSWVTEVVLLVNLEEKFNEEGEMLDHFPSVLKINKWLEERDIGKLGDLSEGMVGGGKVPQSGVFGGALNHLPIEEFIAIVKKQKWNCPEYVQLLVKDENEMSYTLVQINEGMSALKNH